MKDKCRVIRLRRTDLLQYVKKSALVLVLAAILLAALACVAVILPLFPWLPEAGEAKGMLGTLLTAQAAITALTLSVTIFVIQGASTKQDVDDRVYREYIRQSRVGRVFWGSLTALVATGAIFLSESFFGDVPTPTFTPSLRNMILLAVIAFIANLLFVAYLFHGAVRLARPHQWQTLRRTVNERDVRQAVRVFLDRQRRVETALSVGDLDFRDAFADQGEGSARDALRSLLDDGRRAMADRRLEEAKRTFTSVIELVEYALDEISGTEFKWRAPGSRPEWPPLRELSSDLYSFREEVIGRGDVDLALELRFLDFWCMDEGLRRSCGELYTVGLDGFRHSYEIASRMGNEQLRKLFGEEFWQSGHNLMSKALSQEDHLYARQMVRHLEHLLNDSLNTDSSEIYESLHESFERCFRTNRRYVNLGVGGPTEASEVGERLRRVEQDYRIALMGLGGRAAILANSGSIADPDPYLEVVRGKYSRAEVLAEDIAQAMSPDYTRGSILWRSWETEHVENLQPVRLSSERYPLTWFSIRLIELSEDPPLSFNLRGQAQRILAWFETNSGELEAYITESPHQTIGEKRTLALATLRAAVSADEVASDHAIINSELSEERVTAYKDKAYKSAFDTNSIKRIFERDGAVLRIRSDADQIPEERTFRDWPQKVFFANSLGDSPIYYSPLDGDQIGRDISDDVVRLFCESLGDAPHILAPLDTPEELLQAIDVAIAELNPVGELLILLAGDWPEVGFGLDGRQLGGYEPAWQIREEDRMGDIGRYRGHPIVRRFGGGDRYFYVVDVVMWGSFVDAPFEPQNDMLVEVNPVSATQAQKYLSETPELFSDQPDESSKIRKLRTLVEIVATHRTSFLVSDPMRARQIIDANETDH